MPCNKNQQPPSVCPPSSRRLLGTLAINDLPQTGMVCMPSLNRISEPSPLECGPCACDEDDCAPGTCCALNRTCESSKPPPERDLATETCLPNCKSVEVEAMLDEMKNCREMIRNLALEAMEIIHSEHECPMCKQVAQAQKGSQAKSKDKGPVCEHCNETKVMQSVDQGTKCQSKTKFFAAPSTPLRSCTHSRSSSGPIAQTAFQIKEARLPKSDDIEEKVKKRRKRDIDIEENLKKKSKPERDTTQEPGKSKPTTCSCEEEKHLDINCECKGKVACGCGSKSYFQKLFGKKPSICSCNEVPTENEGNRSITSLKRLFKKKVDCFCPEDDDKMKLQNKANSEIEKRRSSPDGGKIEIRKAGVQTSFGLNKCDKDICQCHFPPSYNQFFTCTGQVTGSCSCKKNV